MKIKEWLFNFFHFNKQERNGVFMLCVIVVLLFVLKLLLPVFAGNDANIQFITTEIKNQSQFVIDSVTSKEVFEEAKIKTNEVAAELFVFNPNTISENDAQKLGFTVKLSHTLANFRNKGGRFSKAEDLKKLYGMTEALFHTLEPYILIPIAVKQKDSAVMINKWTVKEPKKVKPIIDLNSADSLSIVELRGIGPAFTKRILKYRKILGGFHSINQLKEVYGMNDSLFQLLSSQTIVNPQNLSKIPINAIDVNSLKAHPYFTYQSAFAVINYRSKHGKLSPATIKELGIFTEEKLNSILPYLSF